jgi:universal stress protein E
MLNSEVTVTQMNQLEKILVVVDKRMRKTVALERGVALARKSGAQLHLCIFDHDPLIERTAALVKPEIMRLAREQFMAKRQSWLTEQAASWADHGLKVECEAIWAPMPHEAILDKVLKISPGLLIKDVQSEPLRQRLIHTPLDWRILRYCPVPVMMVGPSARYLPRRVSAAVDTPTVSSVSCPLNEEILGAADAISRHFEAELHVAHVIIPSPSYLGPSVPLADVYADILHAESNIFSDICAVRGVPRDRRHLLEGDPAVELARFTQRMDIDVLILGAISRTAADRFLLGSTTESLLGQVDCDILLVKRPDFGAEASKHEDIEGIRNCHSQAAA